MNSACVIGIDVGGTKIAAGILRFPGAQGRGRTMLTQAGRGGRAVLNNVLELARQMTRECELAGDRVRAIGLGVCELVDRNGHLASANCIQWLDLPVRQELARLAPTVIEADVRAAAAAESWRGAGRPFRSFLYVTVGTGISCCLVLDGRPFLGAHGFTGTMASSPLAVPCERCGHLSQRSLEEIASGPGLVAGFQKGGGHAATAQEVLSAARAGDARARQVLESAHAALQSQIGLLVGTLDPHAVVIGGGLGLSEAVDWDPFIASIRRHIWSGLQRELPILRAQTGADAGWIGAALCAVRRLEPSLLTQTHEDLLSTPESS